MFQALAILLKIGTANNEQSCSSEKTYSSSQTLYSFVEIHDRVM